MVGEETTGSAPTKKMGRALMILIVGFISTLILAVVFGVLYLNRASDSVIPILVTVSLAVLSAAGFLVLNLGLFKAAETLHSETRFLIFRNDRGELLWLPRVTAAMNLPHWHAYNVLHQLWLVPGYTPQIESFEIDYVFDELLGATFLKWMANHYPHHWDMEHVHKAGISGTGLIGSQREGRDKETSTYKFAESENGFLVHDRPFNEIHLPRGSEACFRQPTGESVFTVSNRHTTFTFRARRIGDTDINRHSILGNKIDTRLKDPGSFYAHSYSITLDAEFSKYLRWSPQTSRQKDWMEQIFANFESDFSWDTFRTQLDDAMDELSEDIKLEGSPMQLHSAQD